MRITFVVGGFGIAGGARVIAMLAEHLRRRGHDVLAVGPPRRQASLGAKLGALVRGEGWPPRLPPRPTHFDATAVPRKELERYRPVVDADLPDADVVVATWWETASWVNRLGPSKGAKAYFIQQYEANFGHPEEKVAATWRMPLRKIVCARWLAELARDRFGDPTALVVPNGIDLDLFQAPPRGKQPVPTVGVMYKNAKPKRVEVAQEVLARVARLIPELRVICFGFLTPGVEALYPPGTEFHNQPPQHELKALYARCDAWLCTSSSEGFHLPPHEAMACRTPVVSTRVGGPTELIEDGVNGFLVDVDDIDGLVDRLVHVLRLPEAQWQALSSAAYQTAARFTWENAAALFERALRSIVAGERPEQTDLDDSHRPWKALDPATRAEV
jgi:glycosyltransferase involved in cell wall biosynthesis